MQALYSLALEPIAEIQADKNSYGFRPLRSAADAIGQCFSALARKERAQYILEGDIRGCFDNISHQWMMENIFMDKEILRKWLKAGYIEKGKLNLTHLGTPQGGIISPLLLTATLSGLEQTIKSVTSRSDKVNVSIYADDFIITGATKTVLENKVKPAVEAFLKERGLSLSEEKTKITHIREGFDFLGMNLRKYRIKLIIKPAKSSVKRLLGDVREIIKLKATVKTEELIRTLNSKIRGWVNYYRHVCSKSTFTYIDHHIFQALWRWAVRRHPTKGAKWVKRKYFRQHKYQDWVFFARIKNHEGNFVNIDLVSASRIPITRHVKIKACATPYDPTYHEYLDKWISRKRLGKRSEWWLCWWNLFKPEKQMTKARL